MESFKAMKKIDMGGMHHGGEMWSPHARRATVVIESTGEEARAVLIDDSGLRGHYRVPPDEVFKFVAEAARAWSEGGGGNSPGSLAVIWNSLAAKIKGVLSPPPPPPPPGPPGDDYLHAVSVMAHHQMLAVGELALDRRRLEQTFEQPLDQGL